MFTRGYLKFLVPISEAERYGSSALVHGSLSSGRGWKISKKTFLMAMYMLNGMEYTSII